MDDINIEEISKEIDENSRLNFQYAILTYPNNYLEYLNDEKIFNILNKYFDYVGAYCENDDKIDHNHHHYFVRNKSKKRKDYKNGPSTFDIPLEQKFICFYKPFVGRNNKEEKKLVKCELYDENFDVVYYTQRCLNLGATKYEIIDKAHPNVRIMKKKGTQHKMLNYIFEKNKCIEKYNHSQFTSIEEFINSFSKENKLTVEDKVSTVVDYIIDLIKKGLSKKDIIINISNNEEIKPLFYSRPNHDKILNMLYETFQTSKNNIRYPTDEFYNLYDYLFLVPKELFDYLEYLNNIVKQWYENNKRDRFTSLILIGEGKSCKTSLIRMVGPCDEMTNYLNQEYLCEDVPFHLLNDIDPHGDEKLSIKNLKGLIGSQESFDIRCPYHSIIKIKNGHPCVFTNNQNLDELFSNSFIKYCKKNCLIICLDENVDLKIPNNNYKEFGKNNYIYLNGGEHKGPIINWYYWDPKSTWWYQNKVNTFKNVINTGCYGYCPLVKKNVSQLHGTLFNKKNLISYDKDSHCFIKNNKRGYESIYNDYNPNKSDNWSSINKRLANLDRIRELKKQYNLN